MINIVVIKVVFVYIFVFNIFVSVVKIIDVLVVIVLLISDARIHDSFGVICVKYFFVLNCRFVSKKNSKHGKIIMKTSINIIILISENVTVSSYDLQ